MEEQVKPKRDWRVPSVAIVCITVLECFAMYKDIDGYLLGAGIAAIAGLGGYTLRQVLDRHG